MYNHLAVSKNSITLIYVERTIKRVALGKQCFYVRRMKSIHVPLGLLITKLPSFFCTKINCICSHVHIYPENFRYLHFVSVFNLRIKQTGRKYIDYVKALTALTEDGILTRH